MDERAELWTVCFINKIQWKMGHVHLINNLPKLSERELQREKTAHIWWTTHNWQAGASSRLRHIFMCALCIGIGGELRRARAFDERTDGRVKCKRKTRAKTRAHRQTDRREQERDTQPQGLAGNVNGGPQVKLIMRVLITCFNFYLLKLVEHTYIIIMMIIKIKMWKT